jgi:hypothetical protein
MLDWLCTSAYVRDFAVNGENMGSWLPRPWLFLRHRLLLLASRGADEADRIDNIVVKIRGIEEQYARSSCRSRRISPPCSIIALLRLLGPRPLKMSSRKSGAAIAGRVVLHNR